MWTLGWGSVTSPVPLTKKVEELGSKARICSWPLTRVIHRTSLWGLLWHLHGKMCVLHLLQCLAHSQCSSLVLKGCPLGRLLSRRAEALNPNGLSADGDSSLASSAQDGLHVKSLDVDKVRLSENWCSAHTPRPIGCLQYCGHASTPAWPYCSCGSPHSLIHTSVLELISSFWWLWHLQDLALASSTRGWHHFYASLGMTVLVRGCPCLDAWLLGFKYLIVVSLCRRLAFSSREPTASLFDSLGIGTSSQLDYHSNLESHSLSRDSESRCDRARLPSSQSSVSPQFVGQIGEQRRAGDSAIAGSLWDGSVCLVWVPRWCGEDVLLIHSTALRAPASFSNHKEHPLKLGMEIFV